MGHERSKLYPFRRSFSLRSPAGHVSLRMEWGQEGPRVWGALVYRGLSKAAQLQRSRSSLHIQSSAPGFTQAFPSPDFKVRDFKSPPTPAKFLLAYFDVNPEPVLFRPKFINEGQL